jgi:hypothetical protein
VQTKARHAFKLLQALVARVALVVRIDLLSVRIHVHIKDNVQLKHFQGPNQALLRLY